jgi:hypothetical protein
MPRQVWKGTDSGVRLLCKASTASCTVFGMDGMDEIRAALADEAATQERIRDEARDWEHLVAELEEMVRHVARIAEAASVPFNTPSTAEMVEPGKSKSSWFTGSKYIPPVFRTVPPTRYTIHLYMNFVIEASGDGEVAWLRNNSTLGHEGYDRSSTRPQNIAASMDDTFQSIAKRELRDFRPMTHEEQLAAVRRAVIQGLTKFVNWAKISI